MPRRHPRTYHRPKPVRFDYRPIVAVVAIVIFSLAAIVFIFALRAGQ
jgi:hypothetical protein